MSMALSGDISLSTSLLAIFSTMVLTLFGFWTYLGLDLHLFERYLKLSLGQYTSLETPQLGVFKEIYVVSLPARQDRRADMDRLGAALRLRWTYADALSSNDTLVSEIMDAVRAIRALDPPPTFSWPEDIDALIHSDEVLDIWSRHPWPPPLLSSDHDSGDDLRCATKDFDLERGFKDGANASATVTRQHMLLTPARVACWHSHLRVIHRIANSDRDSDGASLVLEDDVNMEREIRIQLERLWMYLPSGWDIVFLGHCWSNETTYPSLDFLLPDSSLNQPWHLHRSNRPKCTHAYALSRTGARKLLLHLRYQPFAYSRAIDQAISWLVESGRLRSFSIVPSIVVQRKVVSSDVMNGTGSKWREILVNGVLDGDNITE